MLTSNLAPSPHINRPLAQRDKEGPPCLPSQLCSAPSRPHPLLLEGLHPDLASRVSFRGKCKVLCLIDEETEGQGGAVTRPRAQPGPGSRELSLGLLGFWPHCSSCPTAHSGAEKSLGSKTEQKSFLQTKQPGVLRAQLHTWPPTYITAPNPHDHLLRRSHVSILQMRKPRVQVAQQPD